jgi:hypothetical protein
MNNNDHTASWAGEKVKTTYTYTTQILVEVHIYLDYYAES